MDATTLESSAIRRLERCGLASWPAWFPPHDSIAYLEPDLFLVHFRGCLAGVAPGIDAPIFNRVLGIGQVQPAYPSLLDAIVRLYKSAQAPSFMIQVTPTAEPDCIGDWMRRRGFQRAIPWARLTRGVEPVIEPRDAETRKKVAIVELPTSRFPYSMFGHVVQRAFAYPPETAPWFALFVGRHGWRHYVAIDRERGDAVGAAAWFRTGSWASLEIAGVVPWARRSGIHSALIAREIRDAAEAGCTHATMETAVQRSDAGGQAYRNARRLGFDLAYFTTNWLWGRRLPPKRELQTRRENLRPAGLLRQVEEYRNFWRDLGKGELSDGV